MKIVGGSGIGADNDKTRIIEIEPGDVGKKYVIHAYTQENDAGVGLWVGQPVNQVDEKPLDDPVETAEPDAPFWVKLEPWERLAVDLVKDTREGIVNIVAASCLHGMVISGWAGEAWGRLHVSVAKAIKEAK